MGIRNPDAIDPRRESDVGIPGGVVEVGSRLGKFLIRADLGRGGMGVVYLAEDQDLRRNVALKVLPSEGVNAERRERFLREARVAARVRHPNVVTVYDVGEDSGAIYFTMEYVQGRTLRSLLQEQAGVPLPIPEALRIARAIAEGLDSAHGISIVHRDLKPENVMISQSGGIKILDFGLAKMATYGGADEMKDGIQVTTTESSDEELTTQGRVLGTPSYMSPEQVTGRPLDPRSDLFSLGVILYEMVTGIRPFRGSTRMEVLIAIDRDEQEPASSRNPAVHEALDRLIDRCLAKRPELRCKASEMVTVLDRMLKAPEELIHSGPGEVTKAQASDLHSHQIQTIGSNSDQSEARLLPSLGKTFASDECALLAVILIGAMAPKTRPEDSAEATPAGWMEELRHEVTRRGGHTEVLADGSCAALFTERLIATDLAAQAARAALAVRTLVAGRPIALVMGREEGIPKLPPASLLHLARRRLQRPASAPAEPAESVIVLDELCSGLLSAHFDVRNHEEGPRLLGELRIPDGAQTVLGRSTPFVGRDRELATLGSLLGECIKTPLARAVLVVAPPGMGKSRLAQETVRMFLGQGAELAVWMSFGDCQGQAAPLSLLAQALKSACEIHGDESVAIRREKIARRVQKSVPKSELQRITEFLGEILRTPFPDDHSPPLRAARQDPELMTEQLRCAFVDFIGAETSQKPLLILLEDLHWGDSLTVRFVDAALRAHGDKPFMVLALARPEVHDRFPKLWETQDVHEIHLKPLSRKAAQELILRVLGRGTSAALVERLVNLADGQAFYLEELIRAAVLRPSEALPATVVAMVQARLMDLHADERRLLRAASVFGEVFWQSAVEGLAGGATPELLARLVDREVIIRRVSSQFPSEREYAFRHALLREGAYATLTDADLVLGHRMAAEWLELHDVDNPLLIAEHFERGERMFLAAGFYKEAATQAYCAGDVDAAISYSQRGLGCGATGSVREQLLWVQCDAYAYVFDYARAQPIAQELIRQAQPGSVAYTMAAKFLMCAALFGGKFDELVAVVDSAQSVVPSPDAAGQLAQMLMSCVVTLPTVGHIALADKYLRHLRRLSESLGEPGHIVRAWMHFALAFSYLGPEADPYAALRESEASYENFVATGFGKGCRYALIHVGMSAWFLGDRDRAERTFLTPDAMDPHLPAMAAHRVGILVDLLLARGDLATARLCASTLLNAGRAHHNQFDEGFGRYALAKVLTTAGEHQAAEQEATLAIELLVMPVHRLWAVSLLSVIRRSQGRIAEACAKAAEAVRGCEAMRCYSYRSAELRLTYAEALAANGEHEEARMQIAAASQKLLASASRIPDPELARSFLRNVPVHARIMDLAQAWRLLPRD